MCDTQALGHPWTDLDETSGMHRVNPETLFTVIFWISGLDLKTGNWNFPENPTIIPCNIFLEIFPILKMVPFAANRSL